MYQDKLGCYRVGDLKVYSKLEAIELHTKTGIHPHWDFNEAVFSSYNWTIEPTENILELYRQRAQQLREKYDYIILMYSSGSDSHTALQSFMDNDIKLDEVCSWINYKGTSNKKSYLNEEVYESAIPNIDKLRQTYPWLKHRVIDLTDIILDHVGDKTLGYDWIYKINNCFGPNNIARENIVSNVQEWADLVESGKKLCVVWGKDKPRVHHIDGKFVFRFIDIIDDAASVYSMSGQQPYCDEFFFWTPDLPKLLIKQAHIIKNYLSTSNIQQLPFVSNQSSGLSYRTIEGQQYWLSIEGTSHLVYPNWVEGPVFIPKPITIVIAPRDEWFYPMDDSHLAKRNLVEGLTKINQKVSDYWKNDPTDFVKGIKGCWSKSYFLE
jgi:hypothetical protein